MRLFTALDIPEEIRGRLVALVGELRPAGRLRWSRPENLHVTTKFIGEWPPAELPRLTAALRAVPRAGAIDVAVRGLAWFPNPHHPRVLFAGIAAGPELAELHRATDEACFAAGIPKELKKYSPHLTLARVDAGEGVAGVRAKIAALPAAEFGSFRAATFGLYESAMGTYTLLEEFPLL